MATVNLCVACGDDVEGEFACEACDQPLHRRCGKHLISGFFCEWCGEAEEEACALGGAFDGADDALDGGELDAGEEE